MAARLRAPAILAGLLVAAFAVTPNLPAAVADPLSPAQIAQMMVDRTLEYVQDFNPNGNATEQQHKAEVYMDDMDQIGKIAGYLLCATFSLGPMMMELNGIDLVRGRADIKVPGIGTEGDRAGPGIYSIHGDGNGGGVCRTPFAVTQHVRP
jgi:hypothetical protein